MTSLVFSSCLLLAWLAPQVPASDPPDPQAAAIVASIEKLLADAIAKAEPSVVAIHRNKSENGQETLAVRGRQADARSRRSSFPAGFRRRPDATNMISFDFGSGVVIGDHGEILTLFHVVRGARELIVRAAGKQEFEAEIIAADPRSDLAVIVPVASDGADPPRLKPIWHRRCRPPAQGRVPDRAGQLVQCRARRHTPRQAGASCPTSPASSSSDGDDIDPAHEDRSAW